MPDLAERMFESCARDQQCARRVPDDVEAEALRARLRVLAREQGLRIRTARIEDAVVVVLADADVWHEDAATMRRKLAPPR